MSREDKPWVVRDVPEHTRRKVKMHAAEHGMTMAQALENMVESARNQAPESGDDDKVLLGGLADLLAGIYVYITATTEQQLDRRELRQLFEPIESLISSSKLAERASWQDARQYLRQFFSDPTADMSWQKFLHSRHHDDERDKE